MATQKFPLHLLPPELRAMIFSKMNLEERANMARTCVEAMAYFQRYRIWVERIFVNATNKGGPPSFRVNFDNVYEERYKVTAEMEDVLKYEFSSFAVECKCNFCCPTNPGCDVFKWISDWSAPLIVREMEWSFSFEQIFTTVHLTRPNEIHLRTAPSAGLLDRFQPTGKMAPSGRGRPNFFLWWHEQNTENSVGKVPLAALQRWIDFSSPDFLYFQCPSKQNAIDNRIFDLEQVQRARGVSIYGHVTVNLKQLLSLKATSLYIFSAGISRDELRSFIWGKIQTWFEFGWKGTCEINKGMIPEDSPHYLCTLELLEEYLSLHPLSEHYEKRRYVFHAIDVENKKTNSHLMASNGRLFCTG